MRIRKDSPFYGISEQDKREMLEEADGGLDHCALSEYWERKSGRDTSPDQVTRFLARLRHERAVRDTYESVDDVGEFAEEAASGKARDGLIEAARQKLFEDALASGDKELLLELYRAANEERARERELAVEQRKAAVSEARLELQQRMAQHLIDGNGQRRKLVKGEVVSEPVVEITKGNEKLLQEEIPI